MEWIKLGKIFDPADYELPNGCKLFAQSPQALVFEDFVRIFFSTRKTDAGGKYLSHIAFVDFDKKFKKVLGISKSEVIELGKPGTYDEHGIFPLNVFNDGKRILGYISGWSRRVSVSVETSIGLAISDDNGSTFERIGDGPVLTSSLFEPFLVGDPFVSKINGTYHMWYIFGISWIMSKDSGQKERVYKIGHAKSSNGIDWEKTGRKIISDVIDENECQALPTVFEYNGYYHMYFCFRNAFGFRERKDNAYKIGYAYSKDLSNWIRDDANAGIALSETGWDSLMMCYPNAFGCGDKIYMLYNGNEFGKNGFGLAMLSS